MDQPSPPCPQCSCIYTYEVGALLVCPECAHEWAQVSDVTSDPDGAVIKDAVGNTLRVSMS
ncbi:hypothetical protein A6F55_24775 [Prescottella equi]|uniref:hypothetical protein n=1 Tax=Rhodococcus hoagii TaxID=43767 RepID=UPI000A108D48|nr:hypothetical protein [Prescottella equi]ORJ91985.1 hypothetical protein A6F55_24775 [Prescottella equi]